MRRKFIAGNWKMYKTVKEARAFADAFKRLLTRADADVGISAPFTQLAALKEVFAGTAVKVGAQNVHFEAEGAYTGEISPAMLAEIGVDYVIVGHSERREYFAETDETVNKKLRTLFARDMTPILCVGEKLEQRDAGKAFEIVEAQIKRDTEGLTPAQIAVLTVAYEPIWAIGTGRTATPEQASEMCGFIRKAVAALSGADAAEQMRIQYGGSVKPSNAAEILGKPDVDGALVGGASLVAEDFIKIVEY